MNAVVLVTSNMIHSIFAIGMEMKSEIHVMTFLIKGVLYFEFILFRPDQVLSV